MADTVYVTDGGMAIVTNRMAGAGTEPKFIGWGTGATTAAVNNTALQTAAAPTTVTAVTGTSSRVTTTVTNDTYQVVGTITAGGTLAITEVALFDNATISGAGFFLRGTHDAINVNANDSIEYTIKVKFDQA